MHRWKSEVLKLRKKNCFLLLPVTSGLTVIRFGRLNLELSRRSVENNLQLFLITLAINAASSKREHRLITPRRKSEFIHSRPLNSDILCDPVAKIQETTTTLHNTETCSRCRTRCSSRQRDSAEHANTLVHQGTKQVLYATTRKRQLTRTSGDY